jgi:hypothetical protein
MAKDKSDKGDDDKPLFEAKDYGAKAPPASIETGKPMPPPRPAGALQDTRKSADPTEKPADRPTGEDRGDEDKGPKFGSQKKADANGPLPRVVDQNERAPGGDVKRFKVRADHYAGVFQPVKYILATSAEDAEECYRAATGLGGMYDRLKRSVGKDREGEIAPPVLNTVEMPD